MRSDPCDSALEHSRAPMSARVIDGYADAIGGRSRRLVVVFTALLVVGCGPPTIVSTSEAPNGARTAVVYTYDDGATSPFNMRVGIRERSSSRLTEIAMVGDLGWTLRATWRSPQELVVTFDCDEARVFCSARTDRYWSVTGQSRWRDVRIRYRLSPALRDGLTPEDIRKLPSLEGLQ